MHQTASTASLSATDIADVVELISHATHARGYRPVSDQFWIDLHRIGSDPAPSARSVDLDGQLVAYAQASVDGTSWLIESVARGDDVVSAGALEAVVDAIFSSAHEASATVVTWLVQGPAHIHAAIASARQLTVGRQLHQMRRSLPAGVPFQIVTRSFDPQRDVDAWVAVNARAFDWDPQQGGWTAESLRERMAEPWFDADGFLLHERDGRLAGFCWTKVHTDEESPVGEIYVIAVDPDFHGLGLGRDLTLAGLESLDRRGVSAAMLFVDSDNAAAIKVYERLGFIIHRTDTMFISKVDQAEQLPRWSVSDLHESFESRSFLAAKEEVAADTDRLIALFDQHGIRAVEPREVTAQDGADADAAIEQFNAWSRGLEQLGAYVYATVSTNSYDEAAQALSSEIELLEARGEPLLARFVDWVASLGAENLASVSEQARDHLGPLLRLSQRARHQMSEVEETLYSELSTTGSGGWHRLHSDVTSQLVADVVWPSPADPQAPPHDAAKADARRMPMAAVRGLSTHADPAVRQAGYEAEMAAWPSVALVCAAAINGVKGEANVVNRRRSWASPLDASLYANSVSRPTFDAMQAAVHAALPDLRAWMQIKSRLHGNQGALPWRDLVAPLPGAPAEITWDEGLHIVRNAFGSFGGSLGGILDRAIGERWIDAAPREGKRGGAFCMSFFADRSLVFLNWTGSVDSAQTTAHELGHAYHNTQLHHRTPLQSRLPMALAETASIFCETLVVEEGLQRLTGADRLALLDVDLQGSNQVIVDIHSRFLFETELFARRQRRTLGVTELNEMMQQAQLAAYGDGLDQSTAHPYMWAVKPHYYGSHFYNWPYTYGLLFGLGLFARYKADPQRFTLGYDDLLSRCGMNTAEELGALFHLDVTDEAFWMASIDVLRARIADYSRLVGELGL